MPTAAELWANFSKDDAASKIFARYAEAAKFTEKWAAAAKLAAEISSANCWHEQKEASREKMRREVAAYLGSFRKSVERMPYASDGSRRPIGFVHF